MEYNYHTVEIGSLGHIPPSAKEAIIDILPHDRIQLSSSILLQVAKVSIPALNKYSWHMSRWSGVAPGH